MSREMVLPPSSRPIVGSCAPVAAGDGPGLFAGCPNSSAPLPAYDREEEIFGEGEEAERVYRVMQGAVRTHKV